MYNLCKTADSLVNLNLVAQVQYYHRRSMEKEAKASRRRCFMGEKIAAHMLLIRLRSRQVDKRLAGSKIWGDICILHFLK